MPDEQHDTGAIAQATGYCTTKPVPGTFLTLPTLVNPCPDCGHATLLHIGVDHCSVCEMVDLNQQARGGYQVEVHVEGKSLVDEQTVTAMERALLQLGLRQPGTYQPYKR